MSLSRVTLILLVLCLLIVAYGCDCDKNETDDVVTIAQGKLRPLKWKSYNNGSDFAAFLSIPYAAPPTGARRFKPPVPPVPWPADEVRQETKEVSCAQMNFNEEVEGEEDCLFLHVFRPGLVSTVGKKLPVVFFIPGGGFFCGSHETKFYGPDYLMDAGDFILVSVNYRLGPLGFLSLEDEEVAPGNLGLRDVIAALQWVRGNIAAFGGDPENVNIMGQSAGGMMVFYLILSPQAEGLFHGAISMSGPAISSYTHWDKRPKLYAERLAKDLGCDRAAASNADLIECLQKLPGEKFPERVQHFLHFPWTGPNVWMPHVDGHFARKPVLPDKPEALFRKGTYNKVPMIVGATSDEGAFNLLGNLKGIISFEEIERRWDELGPLILFHRSIDERNENDIRLARKVKAFYFGEDGKIGDDTVKEYIKLMGDHMFYSGIDRTIKILLNGSDESSQPIFEYVYSYDGTLSAVDSLRLGPTSFVLKMAAKKIFGWDIFDLDLGVAHAEEMFLMFKHHIIPTDTIFTPEEALVSQRLVKIVSNFARTKNPNSEGDEKNAWKAVTKNERLAFNITAEPQMEMTENEPHLKRNDFWNRILDEIVVYRNYLSEKPPLLREEVENIVIKDEL